MKITGAVLDSVGTAERPYADSRPLRIVDLELDDPGPDEVLIRVRAAGVCHSDLSVVDGNRPRPTPMLLGHEGAGVVEALGDGVDDLEGGQQGGTGFRPRGGAGANCRTHGKQPGTPGGATHTTGPLPCD